MKLSLRLGNFRSFEDTGLLHLAPVTVLCGANSSGKSSILKSILLVKQSVLERRARLVRDAPSQPLLFNGEWTRLGSWSDVIRGRERDRRLSMEWTASGLVSEFARDVEPRFRRAVPRGRTAEFTATLRAEYRSDMTKREELSTVLCQSELTVATSRIYLTEASTGDPGDAYSLAIDGIGLVLANGQLLEAMSYLGLKDLLSLIRRQSGTIQLGAVKISVLGPFVTSIVPILNQSWTPFLERLQGIVAASRASVRGPKPQWHSDLANIVDTYRVAVSSRGHLSIGDANFQQVSDLIGGLLRDVLICYDQTRAALAPVWKRVRYLGPLRHQPQRYYQFDDTGGIDIGVSGEFTVQVLALESSSRVMSSRIRLDDSGEAHLVDEQRTTLLEATNFWLAHMKLPPVEPDVLRQSLYELKVGELGVALPDVSFGVSQVLPVIVEALRASRGDIVILEQPEIHLHPAVQTALADFLLSRSADGIRFIVETHSEYFVKRLCRRVAENTIADVGQSYSIIFVEGQDSGSAVCRRVELNEYGEVVDWPKGFFDTQEDLYWARASLRGRVAQRRTQS